MLSCCHGTPARVAVDFARLRRAAKVDGIAQCLVILVYEREGFGIDKPFVAFVHHVVRIKHFPERRTTCSHHVEVGAELIVRHSVGTHTVRLTVDRVVVEYVALGKLQTVGIVEIVVAIVAVA